MGNINLLNRKLIKSNFYKYIFGPMENVLDDLSFYMFKFFKLNNMFIN